MHSTQRSPAVTILKRVCAIASLFCLWGCASAPAPAHAPHDSQLNGYTLALGADQRVVATMTGPLLRSAGSAGELIARAQYCAPRVLDSSGRTQTSLDALVTDLPADVQVDGDDPEALVESVDREQGELVANNRAAFSHAATQYVARSKLIVHTQDGAFRIEHRALRFGNGTTINQFPPLVFGAEASDDALIALQQTSNRLAACIGNQSGVP